MTKWTKADIDGLVEGMRVCHKPIPGDTGRCEGVTAGVVVEGPAFRDIVSKAYLRRALYLAAGLTAEGAPKPERVRLWLVKHPSLGDCIYTGGPPTELRADIPIIPGTFIPDGAE